jgi:hypothetical protein
MRHPNVVSKVHKARYREKVEICSGARLEELAISGWGRAEVIETWHRECGNALQKVMKPGTGCPLPKFLKPGTGPDDW